MEDERKLVTKELLAAFGNKCKILFDFKPVFGNISGNWIRISTLQYWGANESYNYYIDINATEETYLNSKIYTQISNGIPTKILGLNVSQVGIKSIVILANNQIEETPNLIEIWIELDNFIDSYQIKFGIFDSEGNPLSQSDYIDSISIDNEIPEVINYRQAICIGGEYPLPEQSSDFGETIISGQQIPFEVLKNRTTQSGVTVDQKWTYPTDADTLLDQIYKAVLADKLSHNVQLKYSSQIVADDVPFSIGNLSGNLPISIPKPNLGFTPSSASGYFYGPIEVSNGIVMSGARTQNIPVATQNAIGGIKIGTGPINNAAWLQVDSQGRAYVNTDSLNIDAFRVDMNLPIYKDHPENYTALNKLFQHIGETTEDFVHGYFYKSRPTGYEQSNSVTDSPYTIGSNFGSKIEDWVEDEAVPLILDQPIKIFISSEDYNVPDEYDEGGNLLPKYLTKLTTFSIQNDPDGAITKISKQDLESKLNIQFATLPEWETATVDNTPISKVQIIVTLRQTSENNYKWKQWDVQPRGSGEGIDYETITNPEIDYLFFTHVESINLAVSGFSVEAPYVRYTLTATLTPVDVDIQTLTWSTDKPQQSTIQKTGLHTAQVVIQGNPGDEVTITVSSDDNPNVKATCTLTIV